MQIASDSSEGLRSTRLTLRTGLVGYTGFVGGNLARQFAFTEKYNSSNIQDIRGKSFDLLVCAAPSAAKWQANQDPEKDRAAANRLLENLSQVRCGETILISTVDVYPSPRGVDESFDCRDLPNHAYGVNRLYVEGALRSVFPSLQVVRLPGLFGRGLKKNVIYDLLHDNCLDAINPESVFQYYDLANLWGDLQIVREHRTPLLNLATEPVATRTILQRFFPTKAVGERAAPQGSYDMQTQFAGLFGRASRYRFEASEVLDQMERFVRSFERGVAA